jgi:hypothetical protein
MTDEIGKTTLVNNKRRGRFLRIAESRVNKVLIGLENLGKCSNPRNYEYTDDEVRRIFREIDRKVREIKYLFQGKRNNRVRFRL